MYADDGGIVCIFQNGVPLIPESRAIAVQREQEVAEHAATGLSIQTSENSIRLFSHAAADDIRQFLQRIFGVRIWLNVQYRVT